jgi:hypothetical protein
LILCQLISGPDTDKTAANSQNYRLFSRLSPYSILR